METVVAALLGVIGGVVSGLAVRRRIAGWIVAVALVVLFVAVAALVLRGP